MQTDEKETPPTTRGDAFRIALGVLGALGGVSVIVLLLVVANRYAFVKPPLASGLSDEERYTLLAQTRADDQKTLTSYGWIDPSKGVVRLPIDVAMHKLVEERNAGNAK